MTAERVSRIRAALEKELAPTRLAELSARSRLTD